MEIWRVDVGLTGTFGLILNAGQTYRHTDRVTKGGENTLVALNSQIIFDELYTYLIN